jgi:hypothetical protein
MACQRSREIDLPAFLAAPRDPEFDAFRLHYPRCAECAAEVRAWTELHEALAAPHPEPEQLARYAALAPQERAAVERHVAGCPSCREELAQLAGFEPARLAAPAPTPAREGGGLRAWLAGLGRIFWHPAFAYALLLLMAVPFAQQLARERAERPLAEALFAEAPERAAKTELSDEAVGGLAKRAPEARSAAQRPAAPSPPPEERVAAPRPAAPAPARDTKAAPARAAPELQAGESVQRVPRLAEEDLARAPRPRAALEQAAAPAFAARESELPSPPEAAPAEAVRDEEVAARTAAKLRAQAAQNEALSALRAPGGVEEPRGLAATVQSEPQAHTEGALRADQAPASPAPRDLVQLEAWRTARVHPPQDVAVLRLAVPVPAALGPGEARVRVRDAGQRRELSERVELPAAGAAERSVTLHVPRSWLVPGAYRVELEAAGAPRTGFDLRVY